MRVYCIFIIALLPGLLLFSCQEQDVVDAQIPEGTYEGVFYRTAPYIRSRPVNVSITFEGNRFSGGSDEMHYPAICNGIFDVNGQYVDFTNQCFFTANFDWTYILGGKYRIRREGEEITLTRTFDGDITNVYVLVPDVN